MTTSNIQFYVELQTVIKRIVDDIIWIENIIFGECYSRVMCTQHRGKGRSLILFCFRSMPIGQRLSCCSGRTYTPRHKKDSFRNVNLSYLHFVSAMRQMNRVREMKSVRIKNIMSKTFTKSQPGDGKKIKMKWISKWATERWSKKSENHTFEPSELNQSIVNALLRCCFFMNVVKYIILLAESIFYVIQRSVLRKCMDIVLGAFWILQ